MKVNIPDPCRTRALLKQERREEGLPSATRQFFRRNMVRDIHVGTGLRTGGDGMAVPRMRTKQQSIGEKIGGHISQLGEFRAQAGGWEPHDEEWAPHVAELLSSLNREFDEAFSGISSTLVSVSSAPTENWVALKVGWHISQLTDLLKTLPPSKEKQAEQIGSLLSAISGNFDTRIRAAASHEWASQEEPPLPQPNYFGDLVEI